MKLKTKKKKSKQAKSSGGLKMALLMHAEKIVIGLTAACVAWLIYGATKLESLPEQRQPSALQNLAREAQDNIQKLNYDRFPDEKKPSPASYGKGAIMSEIELPGYESTKPLNPPEFPRKTPREDPRLFTLDDLEVAAGVGLFGFLDRSAGSPDERPSRRQTGKGKRKGRGGKNDDASETVVGTDAEDSKLQQLVGKNAVRLPDNADVKGRYWVAVMAKVPWSKQVQEYVRTFRDAEYYRPEYDVPDYLGYIVERAEVGKQEEPVWKPVKNISHRILDAIAGKWAGEAKDPADPRYVDELLTFPLPVRAEKEWDDSVLHSDVPRARSRLGDGREEMVAEEVDVEPDAPEEPTGGFGDDFGGDAAGPMRRRQSGGGRGFRAEPDADEERRGRGIRSRGPRPGQPGRRGQTRSRVEQVPFLFFRFIDFEVQPGKQYKYRVRLAVYDPNDTDSFQGRPAVPPRYLGDKVLSRRSELKDPKRRHFRLTDWSEPSPVISVPYPGWLLAGPVKAARPEMHYTEPSAAMIVQMLDLQQGLEGVTEIPKMRRGSVGNFVKTTKVIEYGQSGPTVREEDNFTFQTNTILLDMRGGKGLSRRDRSLTAPGEVLLLDPSGRLIVRTEQSDREEFARLQQLLEAGKQRRKRASDEKTARPGEGGLFGPGEGGRGRRRGRPRNR